MQCEKGNVKFLKTFSFLPVKRRILYKAIKKDGEPSSFSFSPVERRTPPETVLFSPDGKTLLACYRWGGIFSWNVDQLDQPPRVFKPLGDLENYLSIIVSPEEKYFATSSDEKTFRLWEVSIDTPISEFPLQGGDANAAAFSPEANLVAYQDADDQIYIWDVATDELYDSYNGENDGMHYLPLAFCQNGTFLASHPCYIYDVIQRKKVNGFVSDEFQFRAFSHDNNHIWVDGHSIELWHIQRYEKMLSLSMPTPMLSSEEENNLRNFAVSDCGQYLACSLYTWPTSLEKIRIHVYDLREGRDPVITFEMPCPLNYPLAFSPDGSLLAGIDADTILLWDLKPYLRYT